MLFFQKLRPKKPHTCPQGLEYALRAVAALIINTGLCMLTHFPHCSIPYRNQSFALQLTLNDWFLYEMKQWAEMDKVTIANSFEHNQ